MIQRIQSLLLLMAAVCSILLIFLPSLTIVSGDAAGDGYNITVFNTMVTNVGRQKELMKNWSLMIANSLIIVLYIMAILGYRKRMQQVKICNIILWLQAGLLLLLFYYGKQITVIAGQNYTYGMGSGAAFILIAIILIITSRYYILKDEALVRSADRLR